MFFQDCAVANTGRGSGVRISSPAVRPRPISESKFRRWAGGRWHAVVCLGAMLFAYGVSNARAQQMVGTPPESVAESGAVGAAATADPTRPPRQRKPSGALYGTVVDPNGAIISGATVVLSGAQARTVTSDSSGGFSFTALPAGTYSLKVSGPGMSPATMPDITLRPGGIRFLPPVKLNVKAASTSVQVFGSQEALAEHQLDLQLHQRVFGVLPNYLSSYDWNAVHLWPKQKFKLGYRVEIDPVTFAIIGAEAGLEQGFNRFPDYGQGVEGYAKRYGAAYATEFAGTMIGDVVLPSLLHQDPRYFYKGTGSFSSRAWYAISRAVICRGDSGHAQFNYSRVLGDFAAGGISNLYYPDANRGAGLVLTNGLIDIAGNAGVNLVREFILPGLTSHVPDKVKKKSPIHF